MATPSAIPRFLLPRGGLPRSSLQYLQPNTAAAALRRNDLRRFNFTSIASHMASAPNNRVLGKPDQFRPPSHPARRVVNPKKAPMNYPGPPPTPKEVEERKTKSYPNMFPPEGTVMHKFLTNKGIHIWISLSVLFSLAFFTWSTNFKRTSPYAHLLPAWSQLLTDPFGAIGQFLTVTKMHANHKTLLAKEKRKRNLDDIDKRKEYRIAHGLEKDDREQTVAVEGTEGAEVVGAVDSLDASPIANQEGTMSMKNPKRWLGIW